MYKIVITGSVHPYKEEEKRLLEELANVEVKVKNVESDVELLNLVKDADIIMTDLSIIDDNILNNCKNLKLIVQYGAGYDNIDIKTATENGVKVCNVPAYSEEVAEHTMALMFALARNLKRADIHVREQCLWDYTQIDAFKIKNKTFGVIGYSRIGSIVSRLAYGLGMKVVAYDPYVNKVEEFVEMVSFDELLQRSDVISLHVPLTEETHHLISDRQVSLMKENVILINTSRGGVVDELAILNALKNKKIYGVGLDVMENEPNIKGNELLNYDNVLITPHMAWKSEEASRNVELGAVEEVKRFIAGKELKNRVN